MKIHYRIPLTTTQKTLQKYFPFLLGQIVVKSKHRKYGRPTPLKMRSLEKPFALNDATAEKALKDHEGLLKTVLKKYSGVTTRYGINIDELVQVASIGLLRGYESYLKHIAEGGDRKVSTFLAHAIEWDILDCLYVNFSIVRIPKSTLNKKLEIVKKKLSAAGDLDMEEHSRVPNLPFLVTFDKAGLDNAKYEETRSARR